MTRTTKMNNMNASTQAQVSVGTYGSIAKMTEAAALKGNAKNRVLKCGKTYAAAGTDKREIRARLKAVLGDQLSGLKVAYAEVETVSRGKATGKTHIVGTVSLKAAETRKAAETVTELADIDAWRKQSDEMMSRIRDVESLNAELRQKLAELSAALEMLSAHAVK